MEQLRKALIKGLKMINLNPEDIITDNIYNPKSITICKEDDIVMDGVFACKKSNKYKYIDVERGEHTVKLETEDLDAILYAIFKGVIFSVASKYELENRRKGEDPRRQLFAKEKELLGVIKEEYAEKYQKYIDEILEDSPYNDEYFKKH